MKKLLLVLLTSTSLLCNSAYASTDREICENPNSSKADRIQACTRLIEANPKDADAYYHRGSNFVGLRNQPEMAKRAIQDLTRAINLGGLTEYRPALAYFFRSVLFDEAGEYDKAIADASELIKLKTHFSNGGAYLIRGDLYMKKGDHAHAIADYSKAIEQLEKELTIATGERRAQTFKSLNEARENSSLYCKEKIWARLLKDSAKFGAETQNEKVTRS